MKLDAGKKSGRGSLPVGAAGFTAPPCLGEAISRDVAPTATGVACRSRPLIRGGGGGGGGAPGAEAARQGVARLEGFLDFFSDGHLVVGPHKVEQDGLQRGAGHQRPGLLEYDGKPFCLGRVALPGAEAARQGVARLEGFLDFFSDGHLVVGPHKVEQDGLQRGAGHQRPGLLEYDGKPFCLGRVALPGGISQVFQCGDGGVGVEGC